MARISNRTTAAELLALTLLLAPMTGIAQPRSPFAHEMLTAHNSLRGRAGIPALIWSDRLADRAQNWANHLIASGEFSHRPNSPFGENLFTITGAAASPAEVINDWASEARDYDYRSNRCRAVCGHYTQLVWRDTKDVGCAVARSRRENREVWVCNYDPPGNYVGERPW